MLFRALLLTVLLVAPAAAAYRVETVAEGFEFPYSIAFLPDGSMLVTERPGRLRLITAGKLQAAPVPGVPPVFVENHAGLLDVALHPDFATNRWIYFALVQGKRESNRTLLFRARYDAGVLTEVTKLYEAVPDKRTAIAFGGRLAFLPDKTLLVTLGDGFLYREQAQDLTSSLGKIIRLNDDGSIPEDNPYVGQSGKRPEIWTYGHRCVLGIVYDATTKTVYAHENGPKGGDELNIIRPGKNYGWPIATYGLDYTGAYVSPFKIYPGTEPPILYWPILDAPAGKYPSLAPSGLAQCRGCQWPEWEGDLFIGALAGKQMRRVRVKDGKVVEQSVMLSELDERFRDVRFAPDGAMYVLTDSPRGRVLKITPN